MDNWKILEKNINKIKIYHVALSPVVKQTFSMQLDSLRQEYDILLNLLRLSDGELVFAKIFVSDFVNNRKLLYAHPFYSESLKNCALSIIEQPPLNGYKVNVLLCFIKADKMKKYNKDGAFYLELNGLIHVFQSIQVSDQDGGNLEIRTERAFSCHNMLIKKDEMTFADNCVRTWLYVRDIDKDYSQVVKGRNDFFVENGLNRKTHFIASTGIGGSGASPHYDLCADFYSIKGLNREQIKYLSAREYLNSPAEYGVAFERGTCIKYPDMKWIFISGTASIDKDGQCLYQGNVIKQFERLLLNVEYLLDNVDVRLEDIVEITVYLRDVSDYESINRFISDHFKCVPYVITLARVCRPEWLVEMECVAIK